MQKLSISKEQLKNMYEYENLTTFQIADKLGFSQGTIWKRLKEFNIKTKLPGVERVNISRKRLEKLYIKNKLSTWKIEKETSIPRSTIHRKLKEFNIPLRDRSDSHIIYEKHNFSGNPTEKAYLIGFRIGDLGVRKQHPNSKTICIASGSTIKEQIKLIEKLFQKYGNVWVSNKKNGKTNVQTILNESFEFLLSKQYPIWISEKKKTFFAFLGGFTDAEGSITIYNKRARYSLGNYDSKLLFLIYKKLNKYGIKCNPPFSDKRKGKLNNEGYKYKNNYWQLAINHKENLGKLFKEIKPYILHKNKVKALNKGISNINNRRK